MNIFEKIKKKSKEKKNLKDKQNSSCEKIKKINKEAKKYIEQSKEISQKIINQIKGVIRDNPISSILTCSILGILVGMLLNNCKKK